VKLKIRPEEPRDVDFIRSVVLRAFRSQNEPLLVDRLREAGAAALSLVAEADGKVVGHVLFSPMRLDPAAEGLSLYGLAPLAVAPEYQKQGIGSRLVRRALDLGLGQRWAAAFVLGSPGYYSRFGFENAGAHALFCEYDVPEEDFMVLPLWRHTLDYLHGVACYHPIFKEVGV